MATNKNLDATLDELRSQLGTLPAGTLRKKAETQFGLKLAASTNKEDIINAIIGQAQRFDFGRINGSDELKPGWARIKLHPPAGRPPSPVWLSVNGRSITIPMNVEVDVPIKYIRVLENAEEIHSDTDGDGMHVDWESNASYPYSVLQTKDGPDPMPGFEVAREKKLAPKRAFYAKHEHWPNKQELQNFLERENMLLATKTS